jgi:hypothetical protein
MKGYDCAIEGFHLRRGDLIGLFEGDFQAVEVDFFNFHHGNPIPL